MWMCHEEKYYWCQVVARPLFRQCKIGYDSQNCPLNYGGEHNWLLNGWGAGYDIGGYQTEVE